jgi:GAF domain-containing protein
MMTASLISVEIPSDEQKRLAELRRYDILDTEPAASFDLLTHLATYIFHTPISLVSLVDENRLWFKSKCGIEVAETPRNFSFCANAILGNDVFVVRDAKSDVRFAGNPLVVGAPHVRFYAGAPLRSPNGYNLGTLCIMDQNPRDLSSEERDILAGLSKIAVDELELRLKISDLDDEAYRLRIAEETAHQALTRFEEAEYNLIAERVAREMSNIAARSLGSRSAVPSPWPSSPTNTR